MEISSTKEVDVSNIRIQPGRSPIVTRMLALEVGKGFEVAGVERADLNWAIQKAKSEGKTISTKKLADFTYLVFRIA